MTAVGDDVPSVITEALHRPAGDGAFADATDSDELVARLGGRGGFSGAR